LKRWPLTGCSLKEIVWPDDLADAGVEAVTGAESWEAWLAGRRYHYGIIAVADSRWSEGLLDDALTATQPQAVRVPVADSADLGALAAELGRPGSGIPA